MQKVSLWEWKQGYSDSWKLAKKPYMQSAARAHRQSSAHGSLRNCLSLAISAMLFIRAWLPFILVIYRVWYMSAQGILLELSEHYWWLFKRSRFVCVRDFVFCAPKYLKGESATFAYVKFGSADLGNGMFYMANSSGPNQCWGWGWGKGGRGMVWWWCRNQRATVSTQCGGWKILKAYSFSLRNMPCFPLVVFAFKSNGVMINTWAHPHSWAWEM